MPGYTVERVLGITSGSHAWQIPGLEDDELLHHDATAHGDLASAARAKAYEKLIARTRNAGGNAIVNFLYDTRSLSATVMEVIASGTALKVTKDKKDGEEEGEKDDGGDAGKTAKGDDGKEKSLTATEGLIKVLMVRKYSPLYCGGKYIHLTQLLPSLHPGAAYQGGQRSGRCAAEEGAG